VDGLWTAGRQPPFAEDRQASDPRLGSWHTNITSILCEHEFELKRSFMAEDHAKPYHEVFIASI
jgi:hypothetical protein